MNTRGNHELELELTFLAKELPQELSNVEPVRLMDVYIPEDPSLHSRLRLRQKGDKYEATKKIPVNDKDASIQNEYTIPLDRLEFEAISTISNKRIEKDRYTVIIDGHTAEVDVFRGLLRGLALIDFEFGSEEEKANFSAPDCCLADVTQEDFIAGGQLAGKTYQDIKLHLDRFSYLPLEPQA